MAAAAAPVLVRDETPAFMSVRSAARFLGICETNVFSLLASGELTRIKVGKRTLLAVDELKTLAGRLRVGEQIKVGYPSRQAG